MMGHACSSLLSQRLTAVGGTYADLPGLTDTPPFDPKSPQMTWIQSDFQGPSY